MTHVLIVEPDRKLARIFATALERAGHSTQCAALAQDAISAADERRPDLVLLELQLVAHGGIEFLYEFRSYADWQDVPVIIVSHVPPTEFAGSRELLYDRLGVRQYHYKPGLTLQALLASVDDSLGVAA
jgi:DNA-binding response OmpR family regulator